MRASSRKAGLAAASALSVVAAFVFRDVLFGGQAFFGRDMAPFFYPMKDYLARSVQDGRFPFWNPWILNGVPFFGSLQPGHLYPGSLLLYLLPVTSAFDLVLVLHFPLAGVGVYLFLRRWDLDARAALFGAFAFMLGGFLVSVGNFYNNIQSAAWLPWLLLTWDRFVADGDVSDGLWFALASAVAFLGGGADLLAVQLGLVFLYGLVVPWSARRQTSRTSRKRQIVTFAAAGLLALGLVAVQLLPFWELLSRSVRKMTLGLDYAASLSLEPRALVHFLVPPALETGTHGFSGRMLLSTEVPWLLSVYPGMLVLVFAGYGALDRDARRWSLFWGGLCLLGVVLAMGQHSVVYRSLFEWIPGVRLIRYPEKFLVLTAIGLSVLGAWGVHRWMRGTGGGRGRRLVFLLGGIAAVSAAAAGLLHWRPEAVEAMCGGALDGARLCERPSAAAGGYVRVLSRGAAVTAGAAVALAGAVWSTLSRSVTGALLVLLAAADLALAHDDVNPSVGSEIYRERPWVSEKLVELDPDRKTYRYRGSTTAAQMGSALMVKGAWALSNTYLDFQNLGPNVGQVFGHLSQDGGQGVELASVAEMFAVAMHSPPEARTRLMRAASVKYYADPTSAADSLSDLTLVAQSPELPIRIFRVRAPVPRAYLVSDFRTVQQPGEGLRQAVTGDLPLRETVVLDGRPEPMPSPGSKGSVAGARYAGDRVVIRTKTDGRMLLVLTDRHYPGWTATVNGESAPIYRANGQFRAVAVPRGESVVEMRYRPPHFGTGLKISVAAALLWCGLLTYSRRNG